MKNTMTAVSRSGYEASIGAVARAPATAVFGLDAMSGHGRWGLPHKRYSAAPVWGLRRLSGGSRVNGRREGSAMFGPGASTMTIREARSPKSALKCTELFNT